MKELVRKHEEKIRYLVVGAWNTAFGYLAFAFLLFALQQVLHYMLVLVFSYVVSISNAYICYKFFVFKTKGNYIKEYLRFYLVYGFSFLINIILLPAFVEIFNVVPVISQGIITILIAITSYYGHKYYSFNVSVLVHESNE